MQLDVMDAEDLAFESGSFDVVTAAFLLFFLPDPERRRCRVPPRAANRWPDRGSPPGETRTRAGRGLTSSWPHLRVDRRALQRPFDSPAEVEALLAGAGFTDLTTPEGGARDPLRRRRPVVGLAVVVQLSGCAGAARPGGGGMDPLRGDDPPRSGASRGRSPDVAGRVGGLRPPAGHVKRTRGQVVHVQTLADLDARLAAGASSLRGWRVHRLDLTERSERSPSAGSAGATFLGCTFAPGDAARVEDAGGLVLPEIGDSPVDVYRSRLYTPDELYDAPDVPPLPRRAGLRLVAATPRPGGHPRAGSARPRHRPCARPSGSAAGGSWG